MQAPMHHKHSLYTECTDWYYTCWTTGHNLS